MSTTAVQLDFAPNRVWAALVALLTDQLGQGVDVDAIGKEDFDEEGALTVVPPAARIAYLGSEETAVETQARNYAVEHSFAVICNDRNVGADPQWQRDASLDLLQRAKRIAAGARLALSDGETSEPVALGNTRPLPTASDGMAYAVQLCVPGIAQYPAPNAYPQQGGN